MYRNRTVTAIIPALDEEPSIAKVITELSQLTVCATCSGHSELTQGFNKDNSGKISNKFLTDSTDGSNIVCCQHADQVALVDNIVVADNGSTDDTAAIATDHGAIVIKEVQKGYGAACLAALSVPLDRDIVVFVDGDHSVVCNELPALLEPLFSGADLVIGSRTIGECDSGALSLPQMWGNRVASALIRLLWRARVTDLGPFRAITNDALGELKMQDKQFGWTVEMQVRALQLDKKIVEVPVTTRRRIGKSKIGGTVRGVIGASKGILGMIAKLYWQDLSGKLTDRASIQGGV